ncbi:MAG: sulfatase family protein [Flavobacteriaceae bacterium]
MSASLSRIALLFLLFSLWSCKQTNPPPNIIIIYLDDLGYGDVSAYQQGTLQTPAMDKLALGGMRFSNGHASSATCTPSRYALLTGQYPWRNAQAKISTGANLIIDTLQMTLPKMLRQQNYKTGIVGKWHLGLGKDSIDYNRRISPGPNEVGFDYAYIMADTQDRVPTVYIENGRVVNLDPNDPLAVNFKQNFPGEPTGWDNPELLTTRWHHGHYNSIVNGISRIGFMKGGKSAYWSDVDMADHFLEKATEYIQENQHQPFFLFYSLQQPHVPRTPHPRFVGSSKMGPRGDAILEADWCIGSLYNTLESLGLLENTLIILSSDNGPVLNDGYYDDAVEKLGDHTPSGIFRGGKYSLFEAGTRVPFIAYWKGKIKPNTSDKLISQIDLFNSLASLVDSPLSSQDGLDLSRLLTTGIGPEREDLILEASGRTALKHKNWVLIPPYPGNAVSKYTEVELGNAPDYQLYNLAEDPEQQDNLAGTATDTLEALKAKYNAIKNTSD